MARNDTKSAINVHQTQHFGFVLTPDYPMGAVAAAIDVLALANYVAASPLYNWTILAESGQGTTAMNGYTVGKEQPITSASRLDCIIVFAGIGASSDPSQTLIKWLRDRFRTGSKVGAASTGSWILAKAGLLVGRRCTIHWEDLDAFRETYPDLTPTQEIFEVDGRVFTCSGGMAVVDMFLYFVAEQHGMRLANAVGDQIVHGAMRDAFTYQRASAHDRLAAADKLVADAVDLMEDNIEMPLEISEISRRLRTSSRRLERGFKKAFGETPQLQYRDIRLRRARQLLRATGLSVTEIAHACGFSTVSYFSKCYARRFGQSASATRHQLMDSKPEVQGQ